MTETTQPLDLDALGYRLYVHMSEFPPFAKSGIGGFMLQGAITYALRKIAEERAVAHAAQERTDA